MISLAIPHNYKLYWKQQFLCALLKPAAHVKGADMEIIKVFHGSDHVVKQPVYLGGRSDNDYGNGFYTTEYEERARSWAALNGRPDRSIVNIYQLDIQGLKILDLNDCGILAWIAEVLANRGAEQEATTVVADRLTVQYRVDTSQYDIIKGYRADDSYTQVIEAFLLNQINIYEMERLFYKGSLGNQIFLKSRDAFQNIKWVGSYQVTLQEADMESDYAARKEVNRFLAGRIERILLEGYEVSGITARYAIQNRLIYNKEGKFYGQTSI